MYIYYTRNFDQTTERTNRNIRLPQLNQVPQNKILWMCSSVYLLSDEHHKSEELLFPQGLFVSKITQATIIQYHHETNLTSFSHLSCLWINLTPLK